MTHKLFKMLLGLALIIFAITKASAQIKHFNITWDSKTQTFPGNFDGSQEDFYAKDKYYPIWAYTEITGQNKFEVTLANEVYEPIDDNPKFREYLKSNVSFLVVNSDEREQNRLKVKIIPYRVNGANLERLVSFDLNFKQIESNQIRLNKKGNKTQSVLAAGDWYKLKINEDGVYKLDKAFFVKHSINTDNIGLSTFKIFGNGGGMLPEIVAENRPDDLVENAIKINDGNGNNKLDDGDYILFYGKGPDSWKENSIDYTHIKNVYSDFAFYFFNWGGSAGKRLSESGAGEGNSFLKAINESDYLYVHEEESFNLRNSGREWFGEVLTIENKSFDVSIPDLIPSSPSLIKSEVAIRTAISTNVNVYLDDDKNPFITHSGSPVVFDNDDSFASIDNSGRQFFPSSSFKLTYEFYRPQLSSEAWLNYFEIQSKRKLKPIDGQIHFFNLDSKITGNIKYQIDNFTSDYALWDVTDYMNISVQKTFSDLDKSSFIVNGSSKLLRYLLFKNGSEKTPEMVGKIENQNLHNLSAVDYIIITHPDYKVQAEKLAKFHQEREGYSYLITYPEKIYNEFSSGALDITAIRDFVKMLYDRADVTKKPKALLLFGDASFDFKNRINNGNMVPTFESYEYNNSVSSYCSDDYYVILGDAEGYWPLDPGKFLESMDMGVGRLPAKSSYEADVMVDKCIHYKTNSNKGEWRSSLTFLGDDEDYDVHMEDSEKLTSLCEKELPPSNINKIYLDAYKQVSLGNGNAYPDVNETINNTIAKGTLVFNYLGHGGGSGMAHERVVTRPMILGWRNYNKLTFFVTGTCDLAQYDNPKEESPGELMMINDEGGAIGMMTTTRKVYIGLNTDFSLVLFRNNLFARDGNHFTTFGDAYKNVKNIMVSSSNVRNYVMFGDPLLDLNLPVQKTIITAINGNTVTAISKDTLKALSKVEIQGSVVNHLTGNVITDFNGDVSVTLFDKKQTFKTLANDPNSSVLPFSTRNNVLYRGKASVTNGNFKVSFILPKDIDYSVGTGRIFTYAYNDKTDAMGVYDSALVGGTSGNLVADNKGPDIEVFLEDEKFVNGGIVNNNPLLIIKLWDENGINTAGNGVGREILGVLDKGKETSKNYILNDFYSTTLDSFQGGEVRFKLADIAPGTHTLSVRAWDVYNNSNENQVEFLVASDENMALKNLLNYPNPFTTKTNIHFDHNKSGQELNIAVNIFSISGRVVKTLYAKIPNASSHVSEIEWDGKDEYGQTLAKGVYLYKIKVKSEDGKSDEEFQKMVLLK